MGCRENVLVVLADEQEHSFDELITKTGVKQGTLSVLLFKMKRAGLIVGRIPSPNVGAKTEGYSVKINRGEQPVVRKTAVPAEDSLHMLSFYQQMDELESDWLAAGLKPETPGMDLAVQPMSPN